MIEIRPVSDLRNKFPEIESIVKEGTPIFLTKNGYGSMVVMSIEQYSRITDNIEMKLDEADNAAEISSDRLTHAEVFNRVRGRIHA